MQRIHIVSHSASNISAKTQSVLQRAVVAELLQKTSKAVKEPARSVVQSAHVVTCSTQACSPKKYKTLSLDDEEQ